jgi:hypothetical protein
MATSLHYVHLQVGEQPPAKVGDVRYRAVVVLEEDTPQEWRARVSIWLVETGCLYMCAWGRGCSEWDTSVDIANIDAFDCKEIPEDDFVMTTSHEDEPLSEAMWFAKNNGYHPTVELAETMILHVAAVERKNELLALFAEA